jgi:phosphoglycolate phosphatase
MARLNLLFDLDGTLTNSKEGIVRCAHFALDQLGIPWNSSDDLEWFIGPPLQISFAKLLGADKKHLVPRAVELYRERYREAGMFENKLYDGIADCIVELGRISNLYVATSKLTVFSKKILEHFSLSEHFQGVYGSEPDGRNTGKGELIGYLMGQEKLLPETVFMIGDREHDMIGAQENGIAGVGVSWGFGSEKELLLAGAKVVVNHPFELLGYFRRYSD